MSLRPERVIGKTSPAGERLARMTQALQRIHSSGLVSKAFARRGHLRGLTAGERLAADAQRPGACGHAEERLEAALRTILPGWDGLYMGIMLLLQWKSTAIAR